MKIKVFLSTKGHFSVDSQLTVRGQSADILPEKAAIPVARSHARRDDGFLPREKKIILDNMPFSVYNNSAKAMNLWPLKHPTVYLEGGKINV